MRFSCSYVRDAARRPHVSREIPLGALNDDRVAHVLQSSLGALRWYYPREEKMAPKRAASTERLEPLIFKTRERRVLLDEDLARLYGVPTHRFNEAFKRNRHRFPEDFAFQLSHEELENLRSQIAISSSQSLDLATTSAKSARLAIRSHGGRRYRPWVFTEHGALMAANILRSEKAARMSVFVVRAFVRLREQIAANTAILKRLAEIDKTLLEHDSALRDLYRKLLPLLQPPPEPRKRSIGFLAGKEE